VSSRNGTGNNGRNGKVGKNGTCLQYWGGGLEFEEGLEVRILGFYLGFWSLGWGFGVQGLGVWGGGFVV